MNKGLICDYSTKNGTKVMKVCGRDIYMTVICGTDNRSEMNEFSPLIA